MLPLDSNANEADEAEEPAQESEEEEVTIVVDDEEETSSCPEATFANCANSFFDVFTNGWFVTVRSAYFCYVDREIGWRQAVTYCYSLQ